MESYKREEGIFHLGIDETARAYMLETSRWAKFLALIGLILTGMLSIGLVFLIFGSSEISKQFGAAYGIGYGIGMFLFYLFIILIILYPSLTLLRFSKKIKPALQTGNNEQFNDAIKNLKNTFKFWGIYMIVFLAIYCISILFIILGTVVSGF